MAENLNALEITHFLQQPDGFSQKISWRAAVLLVSKTCGHCGNEFKPWIRREASGAIKSVMPQKAWNKQNYCSVKCAKRSKPTLLDAQARKKISKKLKEIKHKPIKRGGNGQLLPLPQLALLHALGEGWIAEHAIKTYAGHRNGIYPNCYKVDIANPELKIAIEIDGYSHTTLERQDQDVKKMNYLAKLGWSVFRVSNEKALEMYTTFKSVDTLLTLLKA